MIQIPKVPFNKVFPSLCTSPIYAGEKGKFVSRAHVLYQIPCTYLEVPIERAPKYLITALYWYVNDRNKQNSFYELFMHYLKRAGYLKNGKKKDGKKTYSEFYTDSITKSNFDNIMQFQNASHEKVLIGQIVLKLKLKMNEAERLFWADGKVLVSQYGDEDYFIDTLIKYAIESKMNNLDFKLLSTQLSKANENRKELDNKEKSLDNYIEDALLNRISLEKFMEEEIVIKAINNATLEKCEKDKKKELKRKIQ